jgi:hypothetical protein
VKIKIDPIDTLFSKMLRLIYPVCQACRIRLSSQVHHYMGRRHQSVRFSVDNCWAVCFTCHRRFHEKPEWGREMMQKRLLNNYDNFIFLANRVCKRTEADRKVLKIWMNEEIKKMGETV